MKKIKKTRKTRKMPSHRLTSDIVKYVKDLLSDFSDSRNSLVGGLVGIAVIAVLVLVVRMFVVDDEQPAQSPEPQPDHMEQMVQRVRQSNKLYTTEYQVHKAVTYDDIIKLKGTIFSRKFEIKLPQGKRKIIIPMDATLKAYIDFSDFSKKNVRVSSDSTSITIVLPEPRVEVTSTKIDHKNVREYVDFLRSDFSQAEMAEFERQGRAAIVAAIPQMGIVDDARRHAYNLLEPMIEALGYAPDKITIEYAHDYKARDYYDRIIQLPSDYK